MGIPDRLAFRIEALHRIRTVLVAPVSVGILTVEMIVFARVDNHRDLAGSDGAAALERGPLEIRHIFHHQVGYHLTGARILALKPFGVPLRAAWLMKQGLTVGSLSLALLELIWIDDVEAVVPTVVRVLNDGILVVAIWR